MKCPVHNIETRTECSSLDNDGWSGYCSLCAKHYPKCTETQHMDSCDLLKGHQGPHIGLHTGEKWETGVGE
jgi:hypothetical protein